MCFAAAICSGGRRSEIGDFARASSPEFSLPARVTVWLQMPWAIDPTQLRQSGSRGLRPPGRTETSVCDFAEASLYFHIRSPTCGEITGAFASVEVLLLAPQAHRQSPGAG